MKVPNQNGIMIRIAEKGDGKGIAESFNEGIRRGINKYTGSNALKSFTVIKKYNKEFIKHKKNEFIFVAIDTINGKIVGFCTFAAKENGRTRHRGEVGWVVHPDYIKRGIATKLLKTVLAEAKKRKFKRVEAEVAIGNISSIRLAKKCGLKIEGQKKAGLLLDNGTYSDTYIFGICWIL